MAIRSRALPRTADVIGPIFAGAVGVDTEAVQAQDGSLVYFDVTNITPSRERNLDEVKNDVVARWRADEIAKRLTATATDMLAR